ncbi:CPCC family cysteine-rich protein [Streptomyces sp. NPDC021020]|uniref:CPCC family cysteine-rich protein n=1 Tax=Streptomyces sp. NPDC021020 TaxID=3365109 RepID=UPI0037B7A766
MAGGPGPADVVAALGRGVRGRRVAGVPRVPAACPSEGRTRGNHGEISGPDTPKALHGAVRGHGEGTTLVFQTRLLAGHKMGPIRHHVQVTVPFINNHGVPEDGSERCPCCRHVTLTHRGGFEMCRICGWEDDGQDDHDADAVAGGPNGSMSLAEARRRFRSREACDGRCSSFAKDVA